MIGTAVYGEDNGGGEASAYRYSLTRTWSQVEVNKPPVHAAALFVLLNPSTATAEKDDPTIRRCVGYAKRWGFGGVWIGNIFAFRATDPADMKRAEDPIGPRNDEYLWHLAASADLIVCGWGQHAGYQQRGRAVQRLLRTFELKCLKLTKYGEPCHPLYLRGDLEPIGWPVVTEGMSP